MKTIHLTDDEHRRLLALLRTQAFMVQSTEWEEALELIDVDRPARHARGEKRLLRDIAAVEAESGRMLLEQERRQGFWFKR